MCVNVLRLFYYFYLFRRQKHFAYLLFYLLYVFFYVILFIFTLPLKTTQKVARDYGVGRGRRRQDYTETKLLVFSTS